MLTPAAYGIAGTSGKQIFEFLIEYLSNLQGRVPYDIGGLCRRDELNPVLILLE